MHVESLTARLEQLSDTLDSEDLAQADDTTLQRLRSTCEALAAAVEAEYAYRVSRPKPRHTRMLRTPAWTLKEFRVRDVSTSTIDPRG